MQSKRQQHAVRLTFHQPSPWASCIFFFANKAGITDITLLNPAQPLFIIFSYISNVFIHFFHPKNLVPTSPSKLPGNYLCMADPWCEVCPVRQSCRGHPWHQDCSKGQKGSNRQFLSPKQSSGPCTSPKQYGAMKRHVSPASGCILLAIDPEKLATPMVSGWASASSVFCNTVLSTALLIYYELSVTQTSGHDFDWKFEVLIFFHALHQGKCFGPL